MIFTHPLGAAGVKMFATPLERPLVNPFEALAPAALRGIGVTLNTKGGGKMALQKHRL